MALHTINRSPASQPCWQDCLSATKPGDDVVLTGDACYALQQPDTLRAFSHCRLGALEVDASSRGMAIVEGIHALSDRDFVDWCCGQSPLVSWY